MVWRGNSKPPRVPHANASAWRSDVKKSVGWEELCALRSLLVRRKWNTRASPASPHSMHMHACRVLPLPLGPSHSTRSLQGRSPHCSTSSRRSFPPPGRVKPSKRTGWGSCKLPPLAWHSRPPKVAAVCTNELSQPRAGDTACHFHSFLADMSHALTLRKRSAIPRPQETPRQRQQQNGNGSPFGAAQQSTTVGPSGPI